MHIDTIEPQPGTFADTTGTFADTTGTFADTTGTFADAAQASAEADANRIEFSHNETRVLEVPMSDELHATLSDDLLAALASIDKLDADIEVEAARHKAAKKVLEGERDEQGAQAKHLARQLRERTVEEDVECRVEKVFATGMIRTVRLDTGAVVDERAMDTDERQADLFGAAVKEMVSDAPESFSDLHEDESSEPPQPIVVLGEVIDIENDDAEGFGFHFSIALETHHTLVHVQLSQEALDSLDEEGINANDHVELVGHYGGEEGADVPLFVASQVRVLDPETEIDATKMATVGDVVAAKKKNGKGRRK